jgi:PleD family two-component response regulator
VDIRMARILTAVAPDTEERIGRILAGHKLVFVRSIADAKAALDDNIKLVFVRARFDESRMFDLIEHIRTDVEQKKIPVFGASVFSI